MDTMVDQDCKTAVSGMDLAMGLLTPDQAAAQLAFAFQNSDPVIQLMRLICRGALPAVLVAGQLRVSVDALRKYLAEGAANAAARQSMGVPSETPAPLFPMAGNWFGGSGWDPEIRGMVDALGAEVAAQLPATVEEVAVLGQRMNLKLNGATLNVEAVVTPLMTSIIQAPLPPAGGMFHKPDGSAFRGVGEVYCAARLQQAVEMIMFAEAQADPADIKPVGFGIFYQIGNYKRLVDLGLASPVRGGVGVSKVFPAMDFTSQSTIVAVHLTDARIMAAAGSTPARIAALAF